MEFRLPDLKGKKVYAKKSVKLYRSSTDQKSFRTVQPGGLIGTLASYKLDVSKVNPTDLKSIKNAKVWFVFKDSSNRQYGFQFKPGTDQIDLEKFVKQGVKTEQQYQAENKAKFEKSPITALEESTGSVLKKYGPLIAAGLVTIILITRK